MRCMALVLPVTIFRLSIIISLAQLRYSAEGEGLMIRDYVIIHDKGQNLLLQVALQDRSKGVQVKSIPESLDDDVEMLCIDPLSGARAYHLSKTKTMVFQNKRITFQDKVLHMEFDPCGNQLFWNTRSGIYGWKIETNSYQLLHSISSTNEILIIALDLNRGQVYWTQKKDSIQRGEVWRMRTDGSDVTKVFTARSMLQAITIDHEMYMLNVMTTSGDMLYMLPLELMDDVNDLRTPVQIDYETKRYVKTESTIVDVASYHGRIYFVHPESGRIYRFSVVLGPSSMEQYGNVTISRSASISFFSAVHYDRNIASLRRCKGLPVHVDEKESAFKPEVSTTTSSAALFDEKSTTFAEMSTVSSLQSLGTTHLTRTLEQQDSDSQSTVDEVYVSDWTTAITHEEATGFTVGNSAEERFVGDWTTAETHDEATLFSEEDSDVRHTTQSYPPQQTEQFVDETTSDITRYIDTTLQPTSTTTPLQMSTALPSSNFETRPSTVGQHETFIPFVDASPFDLDPSHPCFKILESSSSEKASVARAFQLCAAVSGLI